MISISVNTSTLRKSVVEEVTTSPNNVFRELGVDVSRSMVTLNGAMLRPGDFSKTFADLGVDDGSENRLTAVVKADGAAA